MTLSLYTDEGCKHLADYLREKLNEAHIEFLNTSDEIGEVAPKAPQQNPEPIVRSTRSYDALNVPLSEFPLIKVYRQDDSFRAGTIYFESSVVITYNAAYPDIERLPGLLHWVSVNVNSILIAYALEFPLKMPLDVRQRGNRAEYRLMTNSITNSVYPFLRFTLKLRDC